MRDEFFQLIAQHHYSGNAVLDFLLQEIEINIGNIVFSSIGCSKKMKKSFPQKSRLSRRIPYSLHIADYKDNEFLRTMDQLSGKMMIVNGMGG